MRAPRRCLQRGLSLVELMVGTAIGLLIASSATALFTAQVGSVRRLLLEARVQQDLRSATDLMARDLRRAGHWGHALEGVTLTATATPAAATPPPRNPYTALAADPSASTLTYSLSRDDAENDTVDLAERFGFRLHRSERTLQMLTGSGTWQTLTDPGVVTFPRDGLAITLTETPVDLRSLCPTACIGGDCPSVTVREVTLALKAHATVDPAIVRRLETRVRLRNDQLAGRCPA
jgi:prepilin peptidase dependent protein B